MKPIKDEYLEILEEYINEPLFITNVTSEIEKEIENNYWWIKGSFEQISSLTFDEWKEYIYKLIKNRQNQLNNSIIDTDLLFYCWHDHQAGQLRFNVISSSHESLPFGCKYKEASLEKVLRAFLSDEFMGVFPIDMFTPISADEAAELEKEKSDFVLEVYIHKIKKEDAREIK